MLRRAAPRLRSSSFVVGMVAGYRWSSRNDTICGDGKPPVAQRDDRARPGRSTAATTARSSRSEPAEARARRPRRARLVAADGARPPGAAGRLRRAPRRRSPEAAAHALGAGAADRAGSPGSPSVLSTRDRRAPDGRPRLRRPPGRGLDVPRRRPLRRRRLLGCSAACCTAASGARLAAARYRRARHLLAFAAVPIALSLVLWPVKLAALRRRTSSTRGGADAGAGGAVFALAHAAFVLWSLALLADRRARRARLDVGPRGRGDRAPRRSSRPRSCSR